MPILLPLRNESEISSLFILVFQMLLWTVSRWWSLWWYIKTLPRIDFFLWSW